MNPYLKNLRKIEFVVTDACTGRCRHCSEGNHEPCGARIDPSVAADAVRKVAAVYPLETVMTFGGEPLLYPDAVYAVMRVAGDLNIPRRQVITNGYFSKDPEKVRTVARELAVCGVNDLLLSVDAFHQETIPLEAVMAFAVEAVRWGIPLRLQPAWLVSETDENPYNQTTRSLLAQFSRLDIPIGEGNVIFPEGNALKYFSEYFADVRPENPYADDPRDVRCLSFAADGEVLGGNVYRQDIMEILENYQP